jgi:glycine C-acetyltransferase
MDGYLAKLDAICDLAERYDAMVMIDECHATGFIGADRPRHPEHFGVMGRVDIITGHPRQGPRRRLGRLHRLGA